MFNVFTDVPAPGPLLRADRRRPQLLDRPASRLLYGEKAGVPVRPGRHLRLRQPARSRPSRPTTTGSTTCCCRRPTASTARRPSGVCANMYRFVGNDPGIPGSLNPNYNPQYRTIAAEFEAFPGVIIPADTRADPGRRHRRAAGQPAGHPQRARRTPAAPRPRRPSCSPCRGRTSTGTRHRSPSTGWASAPPRAPARSPSTAPRSPTSHLDRHARSPSRVPVGTPAGPHQLKVTADNGQSTVNGLTFHVLGGAYNPHRLRGRPDGNRTTRRKVSRRWFTRRTLPATANHAIQRARRGSGRRPRRRLPEHADRANPRQNPRGAYYENLIITTPVKLQGVGPGGFRRHASCPARSSTAAPSAATARSATDWYDQDRRLTWDGNQDVYDGEVVYAAACRATAATPSRPSFNADYRASIDGFDIRGGDQQGFPGNLNEIGGGPTGLPGGLDHPGRRDLRQRLRPQPADHEQRGPEQRRRLRHDPHRHARPRRHPTTSNENVRIANNRIIANAGTNLAGGIGHLRRRRRLRGRPATTSAATSRPSTAAA